MLLRYRQLVLFYVRVQCVPAKDFDPERDSTAIDQAFKEKGAYGLRSVINILPCVVSRPPPRVNACASVNAVLHFDLYPDVCEWWPAANKRAMRMRVRVV